MRRLLLLLLAALALAAQAAVAPRLRARQEGAGLVTPVSDGGGVAAEVAVPTLALGAFRGLITDYLWLRLIALRERGRTYEARQLAEQICRLQPRLPGVWTYLGQHLAYDMASTELTPEGRWRWLQNGIALLRDRGLRHNPDAPQLYYALARIYTDRIGTSLDDFHLQYKTAHAKAMRKLLGGESLQGLAGAPTLATLRAQDPEAAALLAEAQALGYASAAALVEAEHMLAQGATPGHPAQAEFFTRVRASEGWRLLLRAARAEVLRQAHGLDPQRLLEVDRAWGPLDWRSSDAHAVFWAAVGAEVADAQGAHAEAFRLRRTALLALKNAMRRGRVVFLPDDSAFFAPQLDLVGPVDARYRAGIQRAGETLRRLEAGEEPAHDAAEDEGADDGHGHAEEPSPLQDVRAARAYMNNQISAREDFLAEAITLLAEYGRERDAGRLLVRARQAYPSNDLFQLPYDQLLVALMARRFTATGTFENRDSMAQLIEGSWTRAFTFLALGEEERYQTFARLARASQARWERYLASQGGVDPSARARLALPYEALRRRALHRAASGLPPGVRNMLASRVPGVTAEDLAKPPPELALPAPREAR